MVNYENRTESMTLPRHPDRPEDNDRHPTVENIKKLGCAMLLHAICDYRTGVNNHVIVNGMLNSRKFVRDASISGQRKLRRKVLGEASEQFWIELLRFVDPATKQMEQLIATYQLDLDADNLRKALHGRVSQAIWAGNDSL